MDVVAVSILSGSHLELGADLVRAMKSKGLDRPLIFGGVIPKADVEPLKKLGVVAVYGPGTSLASIARAVRDASEANG